MLLVMLAVTLATIIVVVDNVIRIVRLPVGDETYGRLEDEE